MAPSGYACGSTDEGIRADGRPRLLGERRPRRMGVKPTRRRTLDGRVLAPDPPAASHNRCNAGCSRSGEGWAGGPSRRDAKRPSGDQGCRHPDAGGERRRWPRLRSRSACESSGPRGRASAGLRGCATADGSFRWVFHGLARRPSPASVPLQLIVAAQRVDRGSEGAPSGTRTPNPLIKSQLLCQLS